MGKNIKEINKDVIIKFKINLGKCIYNLFKVGVEDFGCFFIDVI